MLKESEALVARLTPALPGLGIDPENLLDGVAPLQCLLTSHKPWRNAGLVGSHDRMNSSPLGTNF